MRTHKIATITLFQVDAADKQEDHDEVREDRSEDECTWLKFRVLFQLSQELVGIFCVSFLLIICLPVLAFWFMVIVIIVTSCNFLILMKRLWKDAHSAEGEEIVDFRWEDDEIQDLEFQEFVSNFSPTDDRHSLD
jgi:hypothetical protein